MVNYNLQLPAELVEALEELSKTTGLGRDDLVILALVNFLSEPGRISRTTGTQRVTPRNEKYLH